jgi:hypothetical protein
MRLRTQCDVLEMKDGVFYTRILIGPYSSYANANTTGRALAKPVVAVMEALHEKPAVPVDEQSATILKGGN